MDLVRTRVDLRQHSYYKNSPNHAFLLKEFDAEILMFNHNKGTMRVRLYEIGADQLVCGNFDLDVDYIVNDQVTFIIR